jgi:hypothetical protein
LKPSGRTKPIRVRPCSRARSTARLDGAPTAARTGRPATAAFCTSSKLTRPLTSRMPPDSGVRPARSCARRRVQAAGAVEDDLRRSQGPGQPLDHGGLDDRPSLRRAHVRGDVQGLQRGLAADAAARRGAGVPLQPPQVHGDARPQPHPDHVAALAGVDAQDLFAPGHDPLGEEVADRQLAVVTGRAHGDGDGAVAEADLQRLLCGQQVGAHCQAGVMHAADLNGHGPQAGGTGDWVGNGHSLALQVSRPHHAPEWCKYCAKAESVRRWAARENGLPGILSADRQLRRDDSPSQRYYSPVPPRAL